MGIEKKKRNRMPGKKRNNSAVAVDARAETPKRKSKSAKVTRTGTPAERRMDMAHLLKEDALQHSNAELWLIQIPSQISDLDRLASGHWSLQGSTSKSGTLGQVVLDEDQKYEIRVEEDELVQNTTVVSENERTLRVAKAITLHCLSKDDEGHEEDESE